MTAAGLAAATALAYADPPGGFGPGGWGGRHMGAGMMYQGGGYGPGAAAGRPCQGFGPGAAAGAGLVERMEQRLSFLKNELKITPEQKAVADLNFGGRRISQAGPRGYVR